MIKLDVAENFFTQRDPSIHYVHWTTSVDCDDVEVDSDGRCVLHPHGYSFTPSLVLYESSYEADFHCGILFKAYHG